MTAVACDGEGVYSTSQEANEETREQEAGRQREMMVWDQTIPFKVKT